MVKKTKSKPLAALHQSAPQAPTNSNDSETASNVEIPPQMSVKQLLKAFGNQDGGSGQPSQRVRTSTMPPSLRSSTVKSQTLPRGQKLSTVDAGK